MFNFIDMMGNYDSRKIDRYEEDGLKISTAEVTDGNQPYETAVSHILYNDGEWVIVEDYETREEAQEGHDKWVKTMTTDVLPKELVDCCNAGVSQLGEAVGIDMVFPKQDN